jgi:hypothetical protein
MKFAYIISTSFAELRLVFHEVSIINTPFPPMPETLDADHINIAEMSELLTHAVFQLVIVCKMALSECILQEAKNVEVGGC